MSRRALFAISVIAHLGLAVGLGRIERPVARAATAISMTETRRPPEPPKPAETPPPPPPQEAPARATARAKAAPAAPKPLAAPAPANDLAAGAGSGDGLPDFGLSLSGGTGAGMAVAAAQPASAPAGAREKVVKRPQALAPTSVTCDEPVIKPRPKNVPTPSYTDEGRAAAVEGKVRIEITVDDKGRVVSVRVLQGLGHGLDEAALAAARAATFDPATQCGKPVGATFNLGMRFSL